MKRPRVLLASSCAWLLTAALACSSAVQTAPLRDNARDNLMSAGPATVFDRTRDAFSLPIPSLSNEQRAQFFVGNSLFNRNWVTAPAQASERDGLGPLFNARSCSTCHFKDGRGEAPPEHEAMHSMLLRISVPGLGEHGEPLPHPVYGDQLQSDGVSGAPVEARVVAEYVSSTGHYADAESYTLRSPRWLLRDLGYGPLDNERELLISGRVAPAMVGLGLLAAVPDSALTIREDPDDRDHDGISGRANRVWDVSAQAKRLGRFGWKAEQPNLRQQIAAAFLGDMGITSSLFRAENCATAQGQCGSLPSGGSPEIDDRLLESVVRYVSGLAVPAQRELASDAAVRGKSLFRSARCPLCHVEALQTGDVTGMPELSDITIHPYSDLLLHDLGPDLADARPTFDADGREFRTAPLWGLGLVQKVNGHQSFMHDGRARGVAEAVLWHGGEAAAAKQAFLAMPRTDRQALVAFVESL